MEGLQENWPEGGQSDVTQDVQGSTYTGRGNQLARDERPEEGAGRPGSQPGGEVSLLLPAPSTSMQEG